MLRYLVIMLLMFELLFGCARNNGKDNLSKKKPTLEQMAFDFFEDSLLFKPIVTKGAYDSLLLVGENEFAWCDSMWMTKGLFYDKKVFFNEYANHLSKPFYDTLEVISSVDFYGDSVKRELSGYLSYRRMHKNDTSSISLVSSGKMKSYVAENKANIGKDYVFVSVGKHLESIRTKLVIITLRWRSEAVLFDLEQDCRFLFDKNDKLIDIIW